MRISGVCNRVCATDDTKDVYPIFATHAVTNIQNKLTIPSQKSVARLGSTVRMLGIQSNPHP